MKKLSYYKLLTPFRGFAAIAIILHHCHRYLLPMTPGDIGSIEKGYLAVDFFFMLSGFVLALQYGDQFLSTELRTIKFNRLFCRFMEARGKRLLPLYGLTLLFVVVLYKVFFLPFVDRFSDYWQVVFSTKGLLSCIVLMQGFPINAYSVWNLPTWSLSVEWWVYLAFPFLWKFWWGRLGRREVWVLGLLPLAAGYYILIYKIAPLFNQYNTLDLATQYGWLRCLLGFCTGLWIYQLNYYRFIPLWLGRSGMMSGLLVGILLVMYVNAPDLLILFTFPLLLGSLICGEVRSKNAITLEQKLLLLPVFQRLGTISYSLYLIHFLLILVVYGLLLPYYPSLLSDNEATVQTPYLWGWALALGITVFTLFISYFTYLFIEKPFQLSGKTS